MPEYGDGLPPRIEAAPTAVPAFAGWAPDGPAEPLEVRSAAEYRDAFGDADTGLARAVRDWFDGDGTRAIVLRLGDSGLGALRDFTLLSLPPDAPDGDVPDDRWTAGAALCAERRALLLVDPPAGATAGDVRDWAVGLGLGEHAAAYFPRLEGGRGPSGAVAATIARTDARRGVWRAPAGLDAPLSATPAVALDDAAIERLPPVNALRIDPQAGPVVWGGRTLAGDGEWQYVNVRRMFIFLEHSIDRASQWAVFEPNDEPLWARLRGATEAFLLDLFRRGAFAGSRPEDSYRVRAGRDTTTADDLRRGIVNVEVGYAPLRPAEFVCVRIGVWTATRRPVP